MGKRRLLGADTRKAINRGVKRMTPKQKKKLTKSSSSGSGSSGGSSYNSYTGSSGGGGWGAATKRQIDQGAPKRRKQKEESSYIPPQKARNNYTGGSGAGGYGAQTRRGIDNGSFTRHNDWRKTQRENERERTAQDRLVEAARRRVDRGYQTIGEQLPGRRNYRQHNLQDRFNKDLETSEAKWHGTSRKSGYYTAGGDLTGGRQYYVKDGKNWRKTSYEDWKKQNDHDQKEEEKYRKLAIEDPTAYAREKYAGKEKALQDKINTYKHMKINTQEDLDRANALYAEIKKDEKEYNKLMKNADKLKDPRANWDGYSGFERFLDTITGTASSHLQDYKYGLYNNNSVNHRTMASVEEAMDNLKISAAYQKSDKEGKAMEKKLAKQRESEKEARLKEKVNVLNKIDRAAKPGELKVQMAQHGTKGAAKFGLETLGTLTSMGMDIGLGLATGGGAKPFLALGAAGNTARANDKDEYGRSKMAMALRSKGVESAEHQKEMNARLGALSGAIAWGTESIASIGAPMQKMVGKGLFTGEAASRMFAKKVAKSEAGQNLVAAFTRAGMSIPGEGLEEMLEGILNPIAEKMFVNKDKDIDWGEELSSSFHDALIGGAIGGIFGVAEVVSQKRQGKFIREQAGDDELIKAGLRSGESTKSHRIANAVQNKMDEGVKMNDYDAFDLNQALNEDMEKEHMEYVASEKKADREMAEEFGSVEVEDYKKYPIKNIYAYRKGEREDATILEKNGTKVDRAELERRLDEETPDGNLETVKHYEDTVDKATATMQEKLQGAFMENQEEGEEESGELPELNEENRKTVQAIANLSVGEASLNDMSLFSEADLIARETLQETLGVELPAGNEATRKALLDLNAENRRSAIELSINDNIVNQVRAQLGAEGYKDFKSAVKDHGIGSDHYATAYDVYKYMYDAGLKGSLPYDKVPVPSFAKGVLPKDFMRSAYIAGRRAAGHEKAAEGEKKSTQERNEKSVRKAKTKKKGRFENKVSEEYKSNLDEKERARVDDIAEILKVLADTWKVNIQLVDGDNYFSGNYQNGVITVAANMDDPVFETFVHEFMHHMEKLAPKEWKSYADFVAKKMDENDPGSFERAVDHRMQLYNRDEDLLKTREDARREVIADSTRALFRDKDFPKELTRHDASLAAKIGRIIKDMLAKIKERLGMTFSRQQAEFKALWKDIDTLQELSDRFMAAAEAQLENESSAQGGTQYKFIGYADDGRGIYVSDYKKGTPKDDKKADIIDLIQNVWSKKPIELKIFEDGKERIIKAQFDPYYSETEKTDAGKIAGGNTNGNHPERRITLNLGKDYYQILTHAEYRGKAAEDGEHTNDYTHSEIDQWIYFVNEIYYMEDEKSKMEPYSIIIHVKEKAEGAFVYSYEAVDEKRKSANLALAGRGVTLTNADNSSADSIAQESEKDNKNKEKQMSLRERDEAYMKAVESGDMETAQRMVDEAARRAGYTTVAYHGTDADRIDSFVGNPRTTEINGLNQIKGYFSDQEEYAEGYGKNVGRYYLNTDNYLYVEGEWTIDEMREQLKRRGVSDVVFNDQVTEESLGYWLESWGGVYGEDMIDPWMFFNAEGGNITERVRAAGYEGVVWDEGVFTEEGGTAYMPFNSNAIKSADPVTYDDNGNVIPLSERFNPDSDDVRYSVRDDIGGEDVQYSVREEAPPKKTVKGYKVFYVKDGKLYPPMVANPGGSDTPVGVWLNADEGKRASDSKTGRPQVKAGGKGTQGSSGSLAYRPGWHLGSVPIAKQFDRLNPETGKKELFPAQFVWAECEVAADVDYQDEAMSYGYTENGKFRHSYAGLPRVPKDGYYRYRTNPNPNTEEWMITGAMKVTRLLSDDEVNEILAEHGRDPIMRQGGNKTLEELGLSNNPESDDVRYKVREDSEGNELSQGQQEYFKDSKIRDDKGRLMVMYHGTANEFTVFDFSQGGINGTAEGFGIYLADTPEISDKYGGRIIKGYVNITRPAYFNKRDLTEEELANLIKVTAYKEAEEMAEDYEGDIEEAVKDTWISNYVNTYEQNIDDSCKEVAASIIRLNNNDMAIVQEIMNGMGIRDYPEAIEFYDILTEQTGIDGFVTEWDNSELGEKHEIVLAFRSNQVKDIDNQNPTEDPDIQYSVREDLEDDLDKILNNTFNAADGELLIGNTSDFLVNVLGADPYKVTMPARKAYQAMVTEEQAKKDKRFRPTHSIEDNYHDLGKEGLMAAIKASEKPVIAFVSSPEWGTDKRRRDRIALVTDQKDKNGNYIVVIQGVEIDARLNKKRITSNKIVTSYGKNYLEGQIKDALNENRLLYVDKKRSHLVAGGTNHRLARGRQIDFKDNINNFWADVNYEHNKNNNQNKKTPSGQKKVREDAFLYDAVSLSAERVDSLIREYAQPGNMKGNYSKAWIATIDPRDFLKLTVSDYTLDTWTLGSKNAWGQEVRPLNRKDLKNEIQMPFLEINSSESNSVIGHEGRHRMLALWRAGYTNIPVVIIDTSNKESKEMMRDIDLWSQDFGKGPVNDWDMDGSGAMVEAFDLIPINEKHRAVIEETYVEDTKVQFKRREQPEDYEEENERLREKIDKLRSEMKLSHGTILADKDAARIARDLLDMPGYFGDKKLNTLVKELKEIYADMAKDETMDDGILKVMDLARDFVNHSGEYDEEADAELKALNHYLRTTPLHIPKDHRADVAGNKEEWGDWRKNHFGKLKLVGENYPGAKYADDFLMELSELFPGIYNEYFGSLNEYDNLNKVFDYRDSLEAGVYEWYNADDPEYGKEIVDSVAGLIFDHLDAVVPGKNFADRKKAEKEAAVQRTKDKYNKKISKLTDKKNAEKRAAVEKTKEHYRALLEKIREEKNLSTEEKLRRRMEKEQERDAKRRERATRRKLRSSIERDAKQLSDMLLKPTDNKHLPKGYDSAVAALLNGLDFETIYTDKWIQKHGQPSERVMNLRDLREQYAKIMQSETAGIEADDYMMMLIEALSHKVDGKRLADLDTKTLKEVQTVVHAIRHQIASINRAFSEGIKQTISEIGNETIAYMNDLDDQKVSGGAVGRVRDFINVSNAKPVDFFDRLGSPLQTVFQEIVKGEDAHINNIKQSIEYIEDVKKMVGGKNPFEKWSGTKAEAKEFELSNGESIELTPAQVMSLYALNKREQARRHIFASGVVVAPVSRNMKNKVKKKLLGDQLMKTHVRVTYEDVVKIVASMTEEQKAVADKFLSFLNNECAAWGNETSMKLNGYEKFREKNYFPIKSSDMFLNESTQEKQNAVSKLKNTGFTKAVTEFADNPIVIDDFFRVCTAHINTMSMYNAFVPAITDFERVYNYNDRSGRGIESSVKQSINRKFGDAVNKYITTLLQDLNTQYNRDQNGLTIADELLRRWKSVKIGANARVLVQQPTAITRAQVYIDYKYLSKSLAKNANPAAAGRTKKRMWDTAPIAYWKHLGFAQTDVSRDMNDILMGNRDSKWNEFAFGMYGFADDVTWTRIFGAVEEETRAEHPEIEEGSKEWKEHINERFRYIVDRTQVVDSTLHRSQMMRSKDWYMRSITSFMAEPTTQVNMWLTMLKTARDQIKDGDDKAAAKTITRFGQNYIISMVTLSVAASLISAMRESWTGDDDDDERMKDMSFVEKWLKIYAFDDFTTNINLANQLPWVKDIISLFEGYDVQRADLSMIADAIQSAKKFKEYFDKDGDVKYSWKKLAADAAADGAALFGIPVSNIERDIIAARKMYFNAMKDADYAHFKTDSLELNPQKNKGKFIDYYLNELEKGNKDTAEEMRQFLKDNKITQDDIDKTVSRRLNEEVGKAIEEKKPDKMKNIIKKYKKNYDYSGDDVSKKVRTYFNDELKGAIEKGDLDKLDKVVSQQKKYGMSNDEIDSSVAYWTNRFYKSAVEKGDTDKMDSYDTILKRSGMKRKDIYMNRGNMYIGYYDMLIYNAGSSKERHRLARKVASMYPDMTGENYILDFVGNTKSKQNISNWRQRKWTKAQIGTLRYRD